jgi:predicted neuraminidase
MKTNHSKLLGILSMGFVAGSACLVSLQAAAPASPAIVKAEFIAEKPSFASSHASTIVETRDGLVAAWFGGSEERSPDVSIWLSHNDGRGWTAPEEVANGIDEKNRRRYPCWNPVLFLRKNSDLLLFYKVGPSPESWWGMVKVSDNSGKTWSKSKRLPKGIVGPVRNKPIEMADGTLLCGASSEDAGWRVRMEQTKNPMKGWQHSPHLNGALEYAAIQPTILEHGEGKLQILCRTKQGKVTECWSTNNGATWSRMLATALPNPNSALDAVMLREGSALLVYNHLKQGRNMLNVAVSPDGSSWKAAVTLENEPGEFSYPAVIQTSDGLVHVTYTWKRQRIKHVVLDPAKFSLRDMPEGRWPL